MSMQVRDNTTNRKPFSPDRRCHWFDSNGRPYKRLDGGLGCPRKTNCYFAHPTDGDTWRNARPSGDPPVQHLTDDEYRLIMGRHRSPNRAFHHHAHGPQAGAYRPRSLSAERDRRRRERSPVLARRRSTSRDRAGVAGLGPSLAQRIRGRRSVSKEREGRPVGYRSSRSRSPNLRGRLQRTPPPAGSALLRTPRPYSTIPDGPRNGTMQHQQGIPRSPVVLPKVESTDITMKDVVAVTPAQTYRREESIASTHIPSQQMTPSRGVPIAPQGMAVDGAASTSARNVPSSSAPDPEAIKSLLESSKLQWEQISTAVAAATTAASKPNAQNASGDLSAEEKNKIWTSRIELLAAATRMHNDCRSMENDIRDYKQLVDSFSYQALPADDRSVIEGHLQTLQSQLEQKSEEMKKVLTRLAGAKFWPTHTSRRTPPPGEDNIQQGIANEVHALKGYVLQLQGLLKSVDSHWDHISKQLQDNRVSGLGNKDLTPGVQHDSLSQANTFLAEAIVPAELEKVRDSITALEERLSALEDTVAQQTQNFFEEIDTVVTENVQSVMLASTGNVQAKPPEPRVSLTDEQLKMLQTLQQNAVATGQQVTRLSQEVKQMASRNDELMMENMALQAENAQLRQQLEELQNTQVTQGESPQSDRMLSEMRALLAAVRAYITQGSSSQPTSLPKADELVKQIAPYIAKSIPEIIAPGLQNLRNELQETLRVQQMDILKDLTCKMAMTHQTVEAIHGLMDKVQNESSHPQEVDENGIL